MNSKLADRTNSSAGMLALFGVLAVLASAILPILWYRRYAITPQLTDWSTVWPIMIAIMTAILGLMSVALAYGLRALAVIIDSLGDKPTMGSD